MSIKQDPVRIEFLYTDDEQLNEDYNVVFHTEKGKNTKGEDVEVNYVTLTPVTDSNQEITLKANLLTEVVDFLRSKQILKNVNVMRGDEPTVSNGETVPLPNIENQASVINESDNNAFQSFSNDNTANDNTANDDFSKEEQDNSVFDNSEQESASIESILDEVNQMPDEQPQTQNNTEQPIINRRTIRAEKKDNMTEEEAIRREQERKELRRQQSSKGMIRRAT